jgi:hypothetical protein
MNYFVNKCIVLLLLTISANAGAALVDAERYIKTYGHNEVRPDNNLDWYRHTKQISKDEVTKQSADIAKAARNATSRKTCELFRVSPVPHSPPKLIEVMDHAVEASKIACIIKYTFEDRVATQIIYLKKGRNGMYLVFLVGKPEY